MLITVDELRDILRKDDHDYINRQIERFADEARASLLVSIGYKDALTAEAAVPTVRAGYETEFDRISDSYIAEYVRNRIDLVDNEKTLTILAVKCEALLDDGDEE